MLREVSLAVLLMTAASLPAAAEMTDAQRDARWADLRHAIFGDQQVADGSDFIAIVAPPRAEDAAMVPVTLRLAQPKAQDVRKLYLVVDDNPSPLAAVFKFGALADRRELSTRVRIDDYTDMHAIAEMEDGTLYASARFIKAAGGCSAPAGNDPALAMSRLGKMKMSFAGDNEPGHAVTGQLLISHPNASGMQMDQVTRNYIPADFIQEVRISYAGEPVLTVDTDITLSEDPTLRFGFVPPGPGEVKVEVDDSNSRHFSQSWPVAATPATE
jgi:sulfur-oxidizing protein SoxY